METTRPYCAGVDHAYAQVTVVWCPHDQAWSLLWTSWLDDASGSPTERGLGRIDLGPFDDDGDALRLAHARLTELLQQLRSL